jgi:hypothetical protein
MGKRYVLIYLNDNEVKYKDQSNKKYDFSIKLINDFDQLLETINNKLETIKIIEMIK